jgi:hypothetical protein
MAESMLGGILGDEYGKNEAESPEPAAGSEAFAAAVAARLSTTTPSRSAGLRSAARVF